MSMSIPYLTTGRTGQKQRTRDLLVSAARSLLAEGRMPTVEQAADAAGVSRATAYRYFRNRSELLLAVHPWVDEPSAISGDAPEDPEERLARAVDAITGRVADNEAALRAMLRLSLEGGPSEELVLRRGRRIRWVGEALHPLRHTLSAEEFDRLVHGIAAQIGIEVFVWLTDVAGVTREQARELMRWSALSLLRGALGS